MADTQPVVTRDRVNLFNNLETEDGHVVHRNLRFWPNQLSGEYCGRVNGKEYWWTEEVEPIDDAPVIRNRPTASTAALQKQQSTLFETIAHGDDTHRAWLKKAIDDHFAGRPVDKPEGHGTKELLEAQLDMAVDALEAARAQFAFYAKSHAKKNTPEGDAKAGTNLEFANRMTEALAAIKEQGG